MFKYFSHGSFGDGAIGGVLFIVFLFIYLFYDVAKLISFFLSAYFELDDVGYHSQCAGLGITRKFVAGA